MSALLAFILGMWVGAFVTLAAVAWWSYRAMKP